MKFYKTIAGAALFCAAALASNESTSQSLPVSHSKSPVTIDVTAELGFLSVAQHTIQFGKSGTYFSYKETGGQDVLFPFNRISINTHWRRNTFVLLYQPLLIETTELIDQNLTIDNLTYPAMTGVKFTYSFPFYRFSYMYELVQEKKWNMGLGATLQIRNATISFLSTNGELFRSNRDVGIVPALKAQLTYNIFETLWLGTELDGIYAPVSYLNGDNNDVTGAILDASIRAGYTFKSVYSMFLNLRYLGGGAEGQSDNFEPPSDGFVKNWLHFFTVSIGFGWNIL